MSEGSQNAENQQPTTPSDSPINIDLYCLECGYNLRGLSGDPVRCPECGVRSSRAELVCPPRLVRARVRRMEISGIVCFGLAAGVAGMFAVAIVWARPEIVACPVCAAIMPWMIAATEFKNGSLAEPGWQRVLLYNHAYWGLICAPATAMVVVIYWLADNLDPSGETTLLTTTRILASLSAGGAGIVLHLWIFRHLNPRRRTLLKRLAVAAASYEVEARRRLATEQAELPNDQQGLAS